MREKMATCIHCHKAISPSAQACPHCGEPDPARLPESRAWIITATAICFAGAVFGFYEAGFLGAVLGGFVAYALAFVLRLIILVVYLVPMLAYAGLLTLVVLSRSSSDTRSDPSDRGCGDERSPSQLRRHLYRARKS